MADRSATNASFRAALEKIIDQERVALATAIAYIRMAMALLAMVALVRVMVRDSVGAYVPSLIGSLLFVTAASVIIWLLKTGRLLSRAGWLVPLLDTPMIVIVQLVQTSRLPTPWIGLVSSCVMMLGLVVLSSLSLSRGAIVFTAVLATVPIAYRGLALGLDPGVFILIFLVYSGVTAVLLSIVARMRGLIHTSRAQDLLGKYVLGRRIGLGGMAEVFEATYSPEGGFERRVAVKRILPSFAQDTLSMRLFRQEAEVGAMLAHPGVVQVLDFGQHQGKAFLAMEFIDGVSLKDLINYLRSVNQLMPIEVVTHITWQLTEALDYIHTRVSETGRVLNLVHRDLNPPNIMLTHVGDAKVADFGIALIIGQERVTQAGIMRGKLGYAAPEQLTGTVFDGRADLFALGLTLHECLLGTRVFRAEGELELVKQVLEGPVTNPLSLRPDVPAQLDAIVMRLLERDLATRTPTAAELRRQLIELPRELIDVPHGRRSLSALVLKAKEWLASKPPEPPLSASGRSNTDVTATSGHHLK